MKKRKELDALLLNNMNGKKLNKGSGSGKEGHELLRNEVSWDSNSTENDEFFAPPRRMVIKKPHKWRICATSLQLCIFVVMVACIVVTGGLVWMHLDLKQDLDELRLRIAKVESELETSTEQASTVSKLQRKIEQLQRLPANFNSIIKQISHLNSTISQLQHDVKEVRDKIKALPTPSIEGLKESTAQIGSTMQGVQGLQTQHTQQINTLTNTLDQIQTSITEMQGEIARQPETPTTTPKPGSSNPASATENPGSFLDVGKTIHNLQEEQEETTSDLRKLNTTVISVLHWKDDLIPRITALESGVHTSDPSDSSLALKVAQLQSQIDLLRNSTRSQASTTEGHSETPSVTSSDWTHNIESEIQEIQQQLKELNPKDLNNNLLSPNVTRGLQHQIERALSVFKEENLKSVDDLKEQDQALWGRLYQQHNDIAAVEQKVEDLRVRVQDLERKEGITGTRPTTMQPIADNTTSLVDRGATTGGQPIIIDKILTQEDLEISFFKMDVNTDNFLTYQELQDFFGPNTPPEDRLMAFDKNGDGKLDLAEMSTALGFQERS